MTTVGAAPHGVDRGAVLAGLAALGLACLAGYVAGRTEAAPTLLTTVPCGIRGGDTIPIPAELLDNAGRTPLLVGPLDIPGMGSPVLLRFDAALAQAAEARLRDGILSLPPHPSGAPAPATITLACRNGTLSSVVYQSGDAVTRLPVGRG